MAARSRRHKELSVWVNGSLAGHWRMSRGETEFQYEAAWAGSAEGRPLSLSLPLTLDNAPLRGRVVENYFDNLLPESDRIRQRIQSLFRTESRGAFDLLVAIGRDCVGAVQLLPEAEGPPDIRTIAAEPLAEEDLERALVETISPSPKSARENAAELRISIAGAQEKTAFLRHRGKWCRPTGATPTTHIFKLPLGRIGGLQYDMRASLENEWLCSRILAAYGLPIAACEIAQFGGQKALVVERFDRVLHESGKYWLRLVQEDFCQATGTPAATKYESDGGPGILKIAAILRASLQRDRDLRNFLKAQILFWMIAGGDGHAKNFSIRILQQGRYQSTPLYDVLSYWPIVGKGANRIARQDLKMAMSIRGKNAHYHWNEIQRRHFNETARQAGAGSDAEGLIDEILASTPSVLERIGKEVPRDFPGSVLEPIAEGLAASARRLERMKPSPVALSP